MAEAMGAWLGSVALSKLQDMVKSYIDRQIEYQTGMVKDNLLKLKASFTKIEALVVAVERRDISRNKSLMNWLNNFKDAVYDAEDVLDLFEYQLIADKVEAGNHDVKPLSSQERKRKVRDFFLEPFNFRKFKKDASTSMKRLFFLDEDLNDLIAVVKKFDNLVMEMVPFLELVKINTSQKNTDEETEIQSSRRTTRFPKESKMFGRMNEREKLQNFVLGMSEASNSNSRKYSLVSIVGMGGMGKTTLAQSIFNDQTIQDHFDFKAWVCVSEKFDVKRLTIEIVESASSGKQRDLANNKSLDGLQAYLKDQLEGKMFLIVLDDVWNVDSDNWKRLSGPFDFGKQGSKILVTTRLKEVVRIMRSEEAIDLSSLEDEYYWELFKYYAFESVNPKDHPKLENIGKKIASKLKGLPLAAKTVGRLLCSKLSEEYWCNILNSELWKLEQGKDGIVPALMLSYNHLPPHLKPCFVYCSLFPKGYQFYGRELLSSWAALGYIELEDSGSNLIYEGQKYFDELLSRSFFELGGITTFYDGDFYVIHDLLHDVAQSIGSHEIYRVEDDKPIEIPERVRHLYVAAFVDMEKVLEKVSTPKKLRSLVSRSHNWKLSAATLAKLKGLRILITDGFYHRHISLPEEIGLLKHLRYLNLVEVALFPDSLGKLYHLQAFHASNYFPKERLVLPKAMSNLINLRSIYFDGQIIAFTMHSIGQLILLHELANFTVTKEEGNKISELGNLKQLQGSLTIFNLQDVEDVIEAKKAELHTKERLDSLTLHWSHNCCSRVPNNEEERVKHDKEVIEGLQPPPKIKKLKIHSYLGIRCADWFESKTWSSNLEIIKLMHCSYMEILPPLGHLLSLRELTLFDFTKLKCINPEFYGEDEIAFPALEKLELLFLSNLEEWPAVEDRQVFPKLDFVHIRYCNSLRELPKLPAGLKKISICGDEVLRKRYDWRRGGTAWQEICHVPAIEFGYKVVPPPPLGWTPGTAPCSDDDEEEENRRSSRYSIDIEEVEMLQPHQQRHLEFCTKC